MPAAAVLARWAEKRGIASSDRGALVRHPQVITLYEGRVADCCSGLAGFEQVKRIALLGIGSGLNCSMAEVVW